MSSEDNFLEVSDLQEGIARVVSIENGQVWLEPEQKGSCGSCSSSGSCGSKGIGTVANRLEARRFPIPNEDGLVLGDRVIVGVPGNALVKAALTAYGMPILTMLTGGIFVSGYGDVPTLVGMVFGLVFGLFLARILARRLAAQGALTPQFLRRV